MSSTEVYHPVKVPASMLLLFAFWIVGTSVALFLFQGKNLRLFYENEQQMDVFFEGGSFATALDDYIRSKGSFRQDEIYVFHFWNPDCVCDQSNSLHVRELFDDYGENAVFLVVSTRENYPAFLERWQNEVSAGRVRFVEYSDLRLTVDLPATPASAVVQGSGKMNYFGPYSEGGVCLPGDEGLVEGVLDSILSGNAKYYPFTAGYGCYCPWHVNKS